MRTSSDQTSPTKLQNLLPCSLVAILGVVLFAFFAFGPAATKATAQQRNVTFQVTKGKKKVLGRPVEYNKYNLIMLRRDGRLLEYRMDKVDVKQVSNTFTPHTSLSMQKHLQKIFGDQYEVSRTGHYVVVHPRGKRQQWAEPFEKLYNRFTYYFSVRGFTMKPAEFPMVVVVFNSRAEFNKVARKDGLGNPNSYAGYYSSRSNWIYTYQNASRGGDKNWEKNDTLIHEALHQFAFNCGIHQRWAPTPRWCAEGLASMFEAKGVNNSMSFKNKRDRLNPIYLQYLKEIVAQQGHKGALKKIVSNDRLFDENMAVAYSVSWGLSFYLAETQAGAYNRYLQRIAQRNRLQNYTAQDRLADFASEFGAEFELLDAHFARFIEDLE